MGYLFVAWCSWFVTWRNRPVHRVIQLERLRLPTVRPDPVLSLPK